MKRSVLSSVLRTTNHVRSGQAFTLAEVLVVIMIVAILAAVTIPMMQAKINNAKWSEANATAGTIRSSISAYVARYSIAKAQVDLIGRTLDDSVTQASLGFTVPDLTGIYFVPADYEITTINSLGHAAVEVTGSSSKAPTGTKTLEADGSWQ